MVNAMTQHEKAKIFRRLHERSGIFLLPNPWDVGTARILTALKFEALATTSAGFGFSQGILDHIGACSREAALAHAKEIVESTMLPVSADLENGYGDSPEEVQKTIYAAADVGLVGCTIEDTSGLDDKPIYDMSLAVERISAAVEAVDKLDFDFILTARAENYLHGRPDLDDTLKRLQAFEAAGADVLYAPGLPDLDSIRTVCSAVTKPVNVVAGIGLKGITLADLEQCGVRRVSTGSSLARTAFGSTITAAKAMLQDGSFTAFDSAATFSEIKALLSVG